MLDLARRKLTKAWNPARCVMELTEVCLLRSREFVISWKHWIGQSIGNGDLVLLLRVQFYWKGVDLSSPSEEKELKNKKKYFEHFGRKNKMPKNVLGVELFKVRGCVLMSEGCFGNPMLIFYLCRRIDWRGCPDVRGLPSESHVSFPVCLFKGDVVLPLINRLVTNY
jgi:hypothetical protein